MNMSKTDELFDAILRRFSARVKVHMSKTNGWLAHGVD